MRQSSRRFSRRHRGGNRVAAVGGPRETRCRGRGANMKNLCCVLVSTLTIAACGTTAPAPPAAAPAQTPAVKPYGNLAQVMQAIPFHNSNIIFDAQTNDPGAPKKEEGKKGGAPASGAVATDQYKGLYAGWTAVENAAIALQETVNLITIPGRTCMNGKPVPVDQEDFKKAAQGLADAGKMAYDAAKAKDLDKIVDAAGVVTEACAACHEVYRDTPNQPTDRCTPGLVKPAAK